MCGIVGMFLRTGTCDAGVLARMRDLLTHRGPDDAGSFVEGPLGLGHRRLSIIDLGSGHQPMQTADRRFTIVFNGEIYNYRELRSELEADGFLFSTQSDTEVILNLHARDGGAAVTRLNGIFAYALWDASERRLLLARDRVGVKPLYYATTAAGLVFASEIKSLFASDIVHARLDHTRVPEYLMFRQVAGPETLFAGVRSLPPGHVLEANSGTAGNPTPYWDALQMPKPFAGSFTDAVEAVDRALGSAVRRQMIADVPLGTFCSGGIDSSLVTAVAARNASGTINTYSVGFDDPAFDESAYARLAAKACGTSHHEIRISQQEYADALPRLIWHHDLPLNFANSVHIHAVSVLARREVTVVLTGEGADELFGGYPRYYIPRLLRYLDAVPRPALRALGATLSRSADHRLRKLGAFAQRERPERLLFNCATADPDAARALLRDGTVPELGFRTGRLNAVLQNVSDPVTAVASLDFVTYLVSILDRQDKMSMATSIEARVPFLDNEIIDLARSLPIGYRQNLRHRKRVLKDVALRYLPAEIVNRRKSGFGVPLASWFASSGPMAGLVREAAYSEDMSEVLNLSTFRRYAEEHAAGAADHSDLLWPALNLCLWRREFKI
jgi:asparagine synthase (glutamine-hydrolysing)